MPIVAKYKKKEYTTAPEGLWPAVCVDVVDLGLQKSQWGEQYKVEIRWVLDDQDPGNDPKTGKPYMVVSRFTLSLHEKSRLRPLLEAWRGKKFTPEDLEGFDLERLIGVNCQLQVVHNVGDEGSVYANVQAVVPSGRGALKLHPPSDYIRVKDRDQQRELENGSKEITDDDIPF